MGKKVSQHVCVFLLSLCVLAGAGGRAEVRALREELIRISIGRLLGQYHPNSHSCGDDNIISETLASTPEIKLPSARPSSNAQIFKETFFKNVWMSYQCLSTFSKIILTV